MRAFLIDFFAFNDYQNRRMLKRIHELPDQGEAIRIFSHLINSQRKWMARINQEATVYEMSWWTPEYQLSQLESEWIRSLENWISFLEACSEEELFKEILFPGPDNELWTSRLKDIPLQLNYHSIHHRAQIQMLIRNQGKEPDFIDYIATIYRKAGEPSPGRC